MQNKTFIHTPNEEVTLGDGRRLWLSRSVAVACQVIVRNLLDGHLYTLIVKRGPASLGSPGLWCFPCGYLDHDESARAASIRETYEEAGIDLDAFMVNPEFQYKRSDLNEEPWHVDSAPNHFRQNVTLNFCFYFETNGGSVPVETSINCELGEIDEVKWVKVDEVINDYQMAFDHNLLMSDIAKKLVIRTRNIF